MLGILQQSTVSALAALGANALDHRSVLANIATMTELVDEKRAIGSNIHVTLYDSVLGRLLTAAGQPEQACARLDTALQLAEDTGMHFYDAELLRLRAQTQSDPNVHHADISAALALARRQSAALFELRAALDDFDLRGEPARAALAEVVSRFPNDGAWPELVRAQANLG